MKNILRYIIAILLTVIIIAFVLINLLSSTILNEQYVLSKLEATKYYDKMYEYVQSSFENYIYQSGLEESVLENIISKEKIEKDTKIIIENIYDGMNESIDTKEIEDNLNANINKSLKNQKLNATQKVAIDKFVDEIENEYIKVMSHTKYETQINETYNKGKNYLNLVIKVLLITSFVVIIILVILCAKRIYRAVVMIGISLLSSGLILAITNGYINSKIKIQTITILNDAISDLVRDVLQSLLFTIKSKSIIFILTGICLIIIPSAIHYYIRFKSEKVQQYFKEE